MTPVQVFEAYRQNVGAESTCGARAALHYGLQLTESEAHQTGDSGYSAPAEDTAETRRSGTELSTKEPSARDLPAPDGKNIDPSLGSRAISDATIPLPGADDVAEHNEELQLPPMRQGTDGQGPLPPKLAMSLDTGSINAPNANISSGPGDILDANVNVPPSSDSMNDPSSTDVLVGEADDNTTPPDMKQLNAVRDPFMGANISLPSTALADYDFAMPQSSFNFGLLDNVSAPFDIRDSELFGPEPNAGSPAL
jgi:hypothetical protein